MKSTQQPFTGSKKQTEHLYEMNRKLKTIEKYEKGRLSHLIVRLNKLVRPTETDLVKGNSQGYGPLVSKTGQRARI